MNWDVKLSSMHAIVSIKNSEIQLCAEFSVMATRWQFMFHAQPTFHPISDEENPLANQQIKKLTIVILDVDDEPVETI